MLVSLQTNGRPIDSSDGAVLMYLATGRVATTFAYDRYKSAFSAYLRGNVTPDLAFGRGDHKSNTDGPVFSNTLRRADDPDGGYWVPPDLSGRMRERSAEISPFRQYADVAPCKSDRLGGVFDGDNFTATWLGEEDDRSSATATPQLGGWEVPVHEISALPEATTQLIQDSSFDVDSWLVRKCGRAFGKAESVAMTSGSSPKRPKGILAYGTDSAADGSRAAGKLQYIASGTDGDLLTAHADVLYDVIAAVGNDYIANAVWFMNRKSIAKVRKLKDSQNRFLFEDRESPDLPPMLAGYPVAIAPDMPDFASNSYPIAFGNFKEGYQIADKLSDFILRDPYTKKGFIRFHVRRRCGGGVVNFDAIKLLKASAS